MKAASFMHIAAHGPGMSLPAILAAVARGEESDGAVLLDALAAEASTLPGDLDAAFETLVARCVPALQTAAEDEELHVVLDRVARTCRSGAFHAGADGVVYEPGHGAEASPFMQVFLQRLASAVMQVPFATVP